MDIYIYIYIYIQRERERKKEKGSMGCNRRLKQENDREEKEIFFVTEWERDRQR